MVALAIWTLVLWRYAKQESGFLWTSQAEAARGFTQRFGPEAIERFRLDTGRYPTSEEGLSVLLRVLGKEESHWKGPYLEGPSIPKDPWGRDYRYRAPCRKKGFAYEVFSLGPDGQISDDDIGNFTK